MTRARAFAQVDVFTATPMRGNPVAVVLDGDGLSDAAMQQFAHWTNLSETTFVLPPTDPAADYRVRIFTPKSELPFAGHPTLGTAYALLQAGRIHPRDGKVVQQSAVGLVPVAVADDGLHFRLPDATITPAPDVAALEAALGVSFSAPPQCVQVGPVWVIGQVAPDALTAMTPDLARCAAYDRAQQVTGQTLFARDPAQDSHDIIVRSFAAADGLVEDPVCGSGNGAVGAYRLAMGQLAPGDHYTASQGRQCGRDGRVAMRITDDGGIHVGGQCITLITGTVAIEG